MSAEQATASTLAQAAHKAISEGAEVSKRAISAHRRALHNQRQALAELERYCEQHGIALRTQPTTQPTQGGQSRNAGSRRTHP